jgi:uncharacterized membrane protein
VAQEAADRVRMLREELSTGEVESVLALTPDQRLRFEEWSTRRLAALAEQFDVDTTVSQKRVSSGMRVASTLGGIAVCAAVVLFFMRYWGYLDTWLQLLIVILTPLLSLCGAELMSRRERTRYFTGLLALVTLAGFILNLVVVGSVFNMVSTENSMLAWGTLALVLAYRYGLRLVLALGLLFLVSYVAAAFTTRMGYQWLEFWDRPEQFLLLGLLVFAIPFLLKHPRQGDFAPVFRLVGALIFFIAVLSLAEWGVPSYFSWNSENVERVYEFFGVIASAGATWLGIARNWNGLVNTGSVFFTLFLVARLYHWWWDWMPKYLFFAAIGALGIGLVMVFKRLRSSMVRINSGVAA